MSCSWSASRRPKMATKCTQMRLSCTASAWRCSACCGGCGRWRRCWSAVRPLQPTRWWRKRWKLSGLQPAAARPHEENAYDVARAALQGESLSHHLRLPHPLLLAARLLHRGTNLGSSGRYSVSTSASLCSCW
jgi:hypothetical protein